MENNNKEYGEVAMKSPFLEKLDNFWYYYKWHTIVAIFVIVAVLVSSLQMCSRKTTDIHVIYAGERNIVRTSVDGDIPMYNKLVSALSERADDYNGDGEKILTFTTYTFLSDLDRTEIAKNPELSINEKLLEDDANMFHQNFALGTGGEFYVLLCSPYVYEEYKEVSEVEIFMPVSSYLDESYGEYELYSDSAIKLSSLSVWKNSATLRNSLPEDTLVTIRIKSYISGVFGKDATDERYRIAEEYFKSFIKG